jgi:hypothetical protein
MKGNKHMKTITNIIYPALAVFAFTCFAVLPRAQAVSPAPAGCYPGFTTAEGCNALNFLTTGAGNTGVGWEALYVDTTGSFNTGVGAGALILNNGDSNTAVGAAALLLNTTGTENTAVGTDALVYNASGMLNTAVGAFALFNDTGDGNTAIGDTALFTNTTGNYNLAAGFHALNHNTTGGGNTAVAGFDALYSNTTGTQNVAVGSQALFSNTDHGGNTALGTNAGMASTGSFNTFLGFAAGSSVTTGNNVIAIGANVAGADVDNTCFIGNIRDITTQNADAIAVVIDSAGQLGTMSSSARFKKDIKPMDKASEAILALEPVTFHYKSDNKRTSQFGLIAEEVAKVNPDLIVRDRKGEIYSVRYEAVNAMLLNEFLKAHQKIEEQGKIIAQLKSTIAEQMEALAARLKEHDARIQKVSAKLELTRPAPRTVADNQ